MILSMDWFKGTFTGDMSWDFFLDSDIYWDSPKTIKHSIHWYSGGFITHGCPLVKHTKKLWNITMLSMGKSTNWITIFNSYVRHYQRGGSTTNQISIYGINLMIFICVFLPMVSSPVRFPTANRSRSFRRFIASKRIWSPTTLWSQHVVPRITRKGHSNDQGRPAMKKNIIYRTIIL
jgi:hypothetical protein